MAFIIRGMSPEPFRRLFGLSDAELAAVGAVRMVADEKPGFPCRVTLEDAEPGTRLLLVNCEHQPVPTPYRSCHAIFVSEGVDTPATYVDRVPQSLAARLLSLRAFDDGGMMVDADVMEGEALPGAIAAMFTDPNTAYLHAHNAKRGCFAARIDRHRAEP